MIATVPIPPWDGDRTVIRDHGEKIPGRVAEQILEIAFASGVKVREDADLAELLSVVQLDSEIPADALVAVAEILAYIDRANGKLPPLGGHHVQGERP